MSGSAIDMSAERQWSSFILSSMRILLNMNTDSGEREHFSLLRIGYRHRNKIFDINFGC